MFIILSYRPLFIFFSACSALSLKLEFLYLLFYYFRFGDMSSFAIVTWSLSSPLASFPPFCSSGLSSGAIEILHCACSFFYCDLTDLSELLLENFLLPASG
jgi:hypothetical protein